MIATPLRPDDPDLENALALIRSGFAYMEGLIAPPSSVHRLTLDALVMGPGEVWTIGSPPEACAVLTPKGDALYIGKLAVAAESRRRRLGTILVDTAESRARELGLSWLELETRVELTANQATFRAMGFQEVDRTAHPGFDRPTSITYRRAVPAV